jgi:hypothetical protein
MEYIYYLHLVLIAPDSGADLNALQGKLEAHVAPGIPPYAVAIDGNQLTLQIDGYRLFVYHVADPHVVIEAGEIARKRVHETTLQGRVAQCTARFELYGDDDPDGRHAATVAHVLQCIHMLDGVYVYDPYKARFLNL